MRDSLVGQIISDVMSRQTDTSSKAKIAANFAGCGITEFVGTALGHTIGLVIVSADNQLHKVMNIDEEYRSISIPGARVGTGPQIFAADETIKAIDNEVISIELARDTGEGGGHGCLIILSAPDVSNVRHAVEVALSEIERTINDVYGSSAGHLELQYTAHASYALNKVLGAPIGKPSGMTCASPAAIGLVIADAATKSAAIGPMGYASPSRGTSFSNEVIFTFSGDSGVARRAVTAVHETGLQLLSTLDPMEVKSTTTPYI